MLFARTLEKECTQRQSSALIEAERGKVIREVNFAEAGWFVSVSHIAEDAL